MEYKEGMENDLRKLLELMISVLVELHHEVEMLALRIEDPAAREAALASRRRVDSARHTLAAVRQQFLKIV